MSPLAESPHLSQIVDAIQLSKNTQEGESIQANFSIFKNRMLKFTGRYIKRFEGIENEQEIKNRAEVLVEQGLKKVLKRLKQQEMFFELIRQSSQFQNIDTYNPNLGNYFIQLGLSAGIDIAIVKTHSFAFSKSGTATEKLAVNSAQHLAPGGNHGSVADLWNQNLSQFENKTNFTHGGKKYELSEDDFKHLQHNLFFGSENEDYGRGMIPSTVVLINQHAIEHPRELAHEMFAAQMIKEIRRKIFSDTSTAPSMDVLKKENPDVKLALATELPWFDFFMSEPRFALNFIAQIN